jgi:nucleoside-specific outer membrane channel protein Tsx
VTGRVVAACTAGLIFPSNEARAEVASLTDVQVLHGYGFDDWQYSNATANKHMTTVTLEHFGAWEYGDNYFFTDLTFGRFVDAAGMRTGESARLYGEWTPRLGFGKLAGVKGPLLGPIQDLLLASQVGVGVDGFWAGLAGLGIDFTLPPPLYFGVNVYVRKDAFNRTTYQVTPFWELPFNIAQARFTLRGYLDVAGTDSLGVDLNTQPQLLFDLGALAGMKDRLQAGVEWYLHRNRKIRTSAPQAMVRWIF